MATLLTLLALLQEPAEPERVGPLRLRTLSILQSIRAGFLPQTPSTLRAGQCEIGYSATWANYWAFNESDWLLDYEVLFNSVWFSQALSDRVVYTVDVEHGMRFGGRMDRMITDFHDLFNTKQNHRDEFPFNDFKFDLAPRGSRPGVSLDGDDRGMFATSATVTFQYAVLPFLSAALAARTAETVDIHAPGFDLCASLSAVHRIGPVHAYLSLNFAWFGREEFHDIEMRPVQWFVLAAVEWRLLPRTTVIFQYLITQGALSRYAEFSEPSHEVTFGWKLDLAPDTVFEVGLVENLVTTDNSPDFGFHGGLTFRW